VIVNKGLLRLSIYRILRRSITNFGLREGSTFNVQRLVEHKHWPILEGGASSEHIILVSHLDIDTILKLKE
jgi:hypothetical protein